MFRYLFFLLFLAAAGPEEAASKWLSIVDQGQYAESWQEASPLLRQSVKKAEWVTALRLARSPLGHLSDRQLSEVTPVLSLEDFPPGEYFRLDYATCFAEANCTRETLYLTKDRDGTWKVVTYQVN